MAGKMYGSAKDRDERRLKELNAKKPKEKKVRKKRTVPRTVQKSLPYKCVCDEYIFKADENHYSKTYCFEDINYSIANQEEQEGIFLGYCSVLNSFDTNTDIQITVHNNRVNKAKFNEMVLLKHKGDGFDSYIDIYNDMLIEKMEQGQNGIIRSKYLTVTVQASDLDTAKAKFTSIDLEVINAFKKIGSIIKPMTSNEKAIIDRYLTATYAEYMQDFEVSKTPTLMEFYENLKAQPEKEAQGLSLSFELYIKGNLNMFAHKTNVNTTNRVVSYDIKDLGKQLKTLGMLIVLDYVWNRITLNRAKGKRTWIYMDEIYLLFANEYSANFLFELYKRARKWGGVPTGITQNVEDLLKSETARSMLSNTDFVLMLNQAASDRIQLAKLLNISDNLLGFVTNSDSGQGLICCGGAIIQFKDKFPHNELYDLMTTKLEEVA